MNKIYKVVWSKVKHQYVVTSEFARTCAKGASRTSRGAAVLAALMLTMGAGGVNAADLTLTGNSHVNVNTGWNWIDKAINDAINNGPITVTAKGEDVAASLEGQNVELGDVTAEELKLTTEDGMTYNVGETLAAFDDAGIVAGTVSEHAAGGGIAIGAGSAVNGAYGVAVGDGASAGGTNSTAIGRSSKANADNSVALGAYSSTTRANTVSVGRGTGYGQYDITRQITNVADGTEDFDAVNVRQLNAGLEGTVKWDQDEEGNYNEGLIKGVSFDGDGKLTVTDLKADTISAMNGNFNVNEDGLTYTTNGSVTSDLAELRITGSGTSMRYRNNAVMVDEDGTSIVGTFKAGNDAVIIDEDGEFSAGNGKFTVDADGNVLAYTGDSSFSISDGGVGAKYANNVFSVDENGILLSVKGQSTVNVTAAGTTFSAPGKTGVTTISGDDITTGSITGLTNTTWNVDNYVENRAATEGQLAVLSETITENAEGVVKWDQDEDGNYNEGLIKGVSFDGDGKLTVTDLKADTISAMNGNFNVNEDGLTYTTNGSVTSDLAELRITGNGTSMRYRNNAVMVDEDGTSIVGAFKAGNDAVIIDEDGEFSAGNGKFTVDADGNVLAYTGSSSFSISDGGVGAKYANNVFSVDENGILLSVKGQSTVEVTAAGTTFSAPGKTGVTTISGDDITTGSITGLTNTTWNANDVVENRAATEGQLAELYSTVDGIDALAVKYDSEAKDSITFAGENGTALKNVSDIEMNGKSFVDAGIEAGTSSAEYDIVLGNGSWSEGMYAVAIGHDSYVTGFGSVALGAHTKVTGNNSVAIGYGSEAYENNVVSVGSSTTQRRIVNVADGIADSDAATVGQLKDALADAGIDDSKGNVVQYEQDGSLHAGNEGTGSLDLNADGSASLTGVNGNGFTANADGTNTITGNTNIDGSLTINGESIATSGDIANVTTKVDAVEGDVDTIKGQIGANENGKLDLINEGSTLVDGINKNTSSINTISGQIGANEDGSLSLTNGASTLVDGINANTAAIEQNSQAINALGGRVHDLGKEIDSVGAISAALAGLHPLDYDGTGSKFQISAAVGTYDGTQAAAIGGFYHFNEDIMMSIGGATSFEGDKKTAANLGVTFRVGKGGSGKARVSDDIMKRLEAMDRKITALETENQQLKGVLGALDMTMSRSFPDVPENHWAYEAVSKLAGNDVVEGYPDGEFHGDRTMTRYEMAEIIYKAMSRGAQVDQKLVAEFRSEMEQVAANQQA